MPLELAQIVAELVEAVGFIGEVEGRQDGLVDFLRGPTAELGAAMQQDFEEADDAGVLDFNAGISDRAMVIGRAIRCRSAKSTWTLSHWAWKLAKRLMVAWNFWRTSWRWSNPLRRPKS